MSHTGGNAVDDGSRTIAEALGLPPIDQVAWIVRDLDRALETFEPLFGPFARMESQLEGTTYRGRKADVTLRMAFGRSGGLEIELIEPVSGEGPHREMLEKHGEGVHHVRFRVDDLEPPLARLKDMGFTVIWAHEMPAARAKWAYLEGPPDRGGALVELLELPSG
jgi:catechol 2,3-dioxygenase-like lactoylglutathione lyase family enzyme